MDMIYKVRTRLRKAREFIMNDIHIFRRRFIPDEIIDLKDDVILKRTDVMVATKWNTLKPRDDIARGISAYLIDKGIKVSKVFDDRGGFVYWYCDIIDTLYDDEKKSYVFMDLLIDVIVHTDGSVEVLDLDEFADAMERDIITKSTAAKALRSADALLKAIYSGNFKEYMDIIDAFDR